jgi:periplasmic divalent cation tolerance protein
MDACVIYVTAPAGDEAGRIARALVDERLAASANVVPRVRSTYWWNGRLEQAAEALILLKTRKALAERVIARVRELHSYVCPGILVLPVEAGNPAYLQWLAAETTPAVSTPAAAAASRSRPSRSARRASPRSRKGRGRAPARG